MKKINKTKLIIVLFVMLSVAFIVTSFGMAYAYFSDAKGTNASATFGMVNFDDTNTTANFTSNLEGSMIFPGSTIVNSNGIVVQKDGNGSSMYVRAKFEFVSENESSTVQNFLARINNLGLVDKNGNSTLGPSGGATYAWSLQADGYYYLVTSANNAVAVQVNDDSLYIFSRAIEIPTSFEAEDENNASMAGINCSAIFVVQAVQTFGIDSDIPTIQSAFNEQYNA